MVNVHATMNTWPVIYQWNVLLWLCCWSLNHSIPAFAQEQVEGSNGNVPIKSAEDEELLDLVQRTSFQYFHEGAQSKSKAALERIHFDGDLSDQDPVVITTGGTGFGVMAILVGIERGFVTREQGFTQLEQIVSFLEQADRFHGVYPHWLDGNTGKTVPFSPDDDGADLVETSFLMQGLLCVRQYFQNGSPQERKLAARVDKLWRDVQWDWHRGPDKEDILYWHWSPKHAWKINFGIRGWNECLITYVMACSSPTHAVPASVYHSGWAEDGKIVGGPTSYGIALPLKHQGQETSAGPLFWAHYSFLGLDPRGLKDKYADYWDANVRHAKIHYEHCVANPKGFVGYGPNCWGLTASYSPNFYAAHCPAEDLGVISPTAALASMPYLPKKSLAALRYFKEDLGDKILGKYGFYDAFSQQADWYPQRYLAIDQGPIVVMIENHRSGLLWKLFMSAPEVQQGLQKMGMEFKLR